MESSSTDFKRFDATGPAGDEEGSAEAGGAVQLVGKHEDRPLTFCVKRPGCGSRGVWAIRRRGDRWGVALIVIGAWLIVTGVLAIWSVNRIIEQQVDKQTVVSSDPSTDSYKTFQTGGENKGVQLYFSTNWLNITNPTEVLRGEKPVLVEMGPYIYREHRYKHNITFSEDGDSASYVLQTRYVWDEEANAASGLSDVHDMVTTVHPVIQIIMLQLKNTLSKTLADLSESTLGWFPSLEEVVHRSLDRAQLWELSFKMVLCEGNNPLGISPFVTRPARDIFWGYFDDPILLAMQAMVEQVRKIAQAVGRDIDLPKVPGAFPGLYINVTSESDAARRIGRNVARTGQVDRSALQQYVRFQNMDMVYACPDPTTGPAWNESAGEMPACYLFDPSWTEEETAAHGYYPQWATNRTNAVTGTDGSMFKHPMTEPTITIFQEDYRRYVVMEFEKEHKDFRGIKLRRYINRWADWQNCTYVPENVEYFQCNLPQGLTNLTRIGGFPLYLSRPHFLDVDPSVQASVIGLSPSNASHQNYVDIEPITAIAFQAHKRVQLNVRLEDMRFPSRSLATVQAFLLLLGKAERPGGQLAQCMRSQVDWNLNGGLFMPMVWYEEAFSQPHSVSDQIKSQLYGAQKASKCYHIIALVVGVLCIVGALITMWAVRRREKEERERARMEEDADSLFAPIIRGVGTEEKEEAKDGSSSTESMA